ncbi:MAG: glycosyltransferase family 39 protein [Isosphaeraceae bacterium]
MGRLFTGREHADPASSATPRDLDLAARVVMLVATALVCVGLRVRHLDRDSLWYDEVVTMRLARTANPVELIVLLGRIDGTRAPLHPLLLQAWVRVFGPSELSGRSFSAACGVLTVLLVYVLGRTLHDESTGRWAAWLAAVCPPLVYYSQEARMYSWLVLLTCLSWLLFARFREKAGLGSMLLYGLILAALAYSHPLGLFMIAAHGAAYLLVRKSLALNFRSWIVIQLGVLLAVLPWIRRYLDHGTDYPLPLYSARYLFAVPIEYVGGNGLVLLACVLIIAAGLVSGATTTKAAESRILLTWLAVPPVAMYLASWIVRPIFGPPRYHLFIAPAYLILLARGLCVLPALVRWVLAAVGLYLSLMLIEANVYSQVAKADWRGLARWIDADRRPEATIDGSRFVVVVHPSDTRFPRDQIEAARYYLEPRTTVLPGDTEETARRVRQEAAGGTHVLDVHCLPAGESRRPEPPSSGDRPGDGPPPLYGLDIRRR